MSRYRLSDGTKIWPSQAKVFYLVVKRVARFVEELWVQKKDLDGWDELAKSQAPKYARYLSPTSVWKDIKHELGEEFLKSNRISDKKLVNEAFSRLEKYELVYHRRSGNTTLHVPYRKGLVLMRAWNSFDTRIYPIHVDVRPLADDHNVSPSIRELLRNSIQMLDHVRPGRSDQSLQWHQLETSIGNISYKALKQVGVPISATDQDVDRGSLYTLQKLIEGEPLVGKIPSLALERALEIFGSEKCKRLVIIRLWPYHFVDYAIGPVDQEVTRIEAGVDALKRQAIRNQYASQRRLTAYAPTDDTKSVREGTVDGDFFSIDNGPIDIFSDIQTDGKISSVRYPSGAGECYTKPVVVTNVESLNAAPQACAALCRTLGEAKRLIEDPYWVAVTFFDNFTNYFVKFTKDLGTIYPRVARLFS